MFIRDLKKCPEFTSGDNCVLKELFHPLKDPLALKYSLAHAVVEPGKTTYLHRLKSSEVYFILKGRGEMHINGEIKNVRKGQAVYIPPHLTQRIKNTGRGDLVFLCIVDPAWKKEDEEIAEGEK
jgi:mannose-6-phosphate isomerase-like protein (cupin superfamily)